MKKKRLRKVMYWWAFFMLIWLVFAQSCMKFRISDAKAKSEFDKYNIPIKINAIQIDGRNIHYTQTGNDTMPTIIFIHGSPGSWDAFKEYMKDKDLLSKYRMVSIDRPGFGFSDFGKAENLTRQTELISPVFYNLINGKPMYLVGHSLGGPLIIKLAANNPGMFKGLVVLAGSTDPKLEKKESWRPVLYKTPLNFFVPGALRPSNKELWFLKKDLIEMQDDYKKINCKVFIVHGNKDGFVPVENVNYTQKMLINAVAVEKQILEGASHFIVWQNYTVIKEVLMQL